MNATTGEQWHDDNEPHVPPLTDVELCVVTRDTLTRSVTLGTYDDADDALSMLLLAYQSRSMGAFAAESPVPEVKWQLWSVKRTLPDSLTESRELLADLGSWRTFEGGLLLLSRAFTDALTSDVANALEAFLACWPLASDMPARRVERIDYITHDRPGPTASPAPFANTASRRSPVTQGDRRA